MPNYKSDTGHSIHIPTGDAELAGILYIPKEAKGMVLFVHGSGSSRLSKRNQHVAKVLNEGNLATLLFDLLTPQEEDIDIYTREFRFDIPFLASRLVDTTQWCLKEFSQQPLSIGYFGSSTGGGAALVAAAKETDTIKAVVSRGGRPDLAGESLPKVKAPTLLIVGGQDETVIEMNKAAKSEMTCPVSLEIVPGATHLFEEPGTLDEVARLAREWFLKHLSTDKFTHE
ncbi:alpha/beta hydrolase [Legionella israelensis]|uniref:dienelactone hydrolase family protein n=1 Tax=Legionella israelensis TaxID=454 RepID=UPI00118169A1|nr:alpha/beta family hydrolase [Legionella israelensis]QDP71937.1 alpha/beta hydrolase [Legionella israelensis]